MNLEKPRHFKGFGTVMPASIIDRNEIYKEREKSVKEKEQSLVDRLRKNPYGGEETPQS